MKPEDIPEIKLRALEPEDLDVLYKIENDTKLWNVGVTNVPYSRFALHNYIADSLNDIYADKQLRLMIENNEHEVVGIIDLVNFDPRHQRAEVGVVIVNSYRRKGYATAAIAKLKDYARNILCLHQLYALVADDNETCIELLSGCGFVRKAKLSEWLHRGEAYCDAALMQCLLGKSPVSVG